MQTDENNNCLGVQVFVFFKVKAQNFFQNGQNYHFDVVGVNACGAERIANETHVTISNALRGAVGKQTGLIYEKILLMM